MPFRYLTLCDSSVLRIAMWRGSSGFETSMNSTPFWRCPTKHTSPATSTPVASSQTSKRERTFGADGFVASMIQSAFSRAVT